MIRFLGSANTCYSARIVYSLFKDLVDKRFYSGAANGGLIVSNCSIFMRIRLEKENSLDFYDF